MIILFSTNFAMKNVASTENMDGNINDFRIMMDLPDNYTLTDAERIVSLVEDTIRAKAEEYQVRTIDAGFRANFARITGLSRARRDQSLVSNHFGRIGEINWITHYTPNGS
jgi:hypothetical protein